MNLKRKETKENRGKMNEKKLEAVKECRLKYGFGPCKYAPFWF